MSVQIVAYKYTGSDHMLKNLASKGVNIEVEQNDMYFVCNQTRNEIKLDDVFVRLDQAQFDNLINNSTCLGKMTDTQYRELRAKEYALMHGYDTENTVIESGEATLTDQSSLQIAGVRFKKG